MPRLLFALLLLGLLAGGFARADAAVASSCIDSSVQQCAAPGSAALEMTGNGCSLACPASCIAALPRADDPGMAHLRPSPFHEARAFKYSRAPDTAPPRTFNL